MARIVYGCFLHETNTFAPDLADWAAFEAGGGWPGLAFDEQVWPAIQGCNISAAGFVEKALTQIRRSCLLLISFASCFSLCVFALRFFRKDINPKTQRKMRGTKAKVVFCH